MKKLGKQFGNSGLVFCVALSAGFFDDQQVTAIANQSVKCGDSKETSSNEIAEEALKKRNK